MFLLLLHLCEWLAYYEIYDWIITIVIKRHEIILMWKDTNV